MQIYDTIFSPRNNLHQHPTQEHPDTITDTDTDTSSPTSTCNTSTEMPLPSLAHFLQNHVHQCQAPNEGRCSICLDDLNNGDPVVRIELNHGPHPCFYHNDCIQAWFVSVSPKRRACPNHQIDLFDHVLDENDDLAEVDLAENNFAGIPEDWMFRGVHGELSVHRAVLLGCVYVLCVGWSMYCFIAY